MPKKTTPLNNNTTSDNNYICPGCKQHFSIDQLDHQNKISSDELLLWQQYSSDISDNHIGHKPCTKCSKQVRYLKRKSSFVENLREKKRVRLDNSMNTILNDSMTILSDLLNKTGYEDMDHLIIYLRDLYIKSLFPQPVEYQCNTCRFIHGNIQSEVL